MSELKANPHCCEEASLWSSQFYIPCNKPAANIVGWKGRQDKPIRMCEMCSDHNVNNRGGYIVSPYTNTPETDPFWNKDVISLGSNAGIVKPLDTNPMQSLNPWDNMNEDALLLLWSDKKAAFEKAKAEEMDLRKYIVGREFPKKQEGTNTKELGNGYQLKAGINYNYKLADNDTVEDVLNRISTLGNEGAFIASRLVSWTPNFLLTEYRQLQEDAEKGSQFAKQALDEVNKMLTISEAAPTLEIKAPKAKK